MAKLKIADFDSAKVDLDFIKTIEISENETEVSRIGTVIQTRIDKLSDSDYYPLVIGAVWAPGLTFSTYDTYLVHNGETFAPSYLADLPLITGLEPNDSFTNLKSILTHGIDSIRGYSVDRLSGLTDLTFRNQEDMVSLLSLDGSAMNAPEGSALSISNNAGEVIAYKVVNASNIVLGDVAIELSNGLYAKEIKYALDPNAGSPIKDLSIDNDAMNRRKPDFKYFGFNVNPGISGKTATIGQDGLVYFFGTAFPLSSIKAFSSEANSVKEITFTATENVKKEATLGADGRLYMPPFDTNNGYLIALNTKTGESQEIAVDHSSNFGATKSYDFGNGVIADNGIIYHFPQDNNGAMGLLKIDTNSGAVSFTNLNVTYGAGTYTGGCVAPNGKIYLAPDTASSFLEFDPVTDTFIEFGTVTHTGSGRRFSGIVVGINGNLYAMPDYKESVHEINPMTLDINNQFITTTQSSRGGAGILSSCVAGSGMIYASTSDNSPLIVEIDVENSTYFDYTFLGDNGIGDMYSLIVDKYGKIFASNTNGSLLISGLKNNLKWTKSAYVTKG